MNEGKKKVQVEFNVISDLNKEYLQRAIEPRFQQALLKMRDDDFSIENFDFHCSNIKIS